MHGHMPVPTLLMFTHQQPDTRKPLLEVPNLSVRPVLLALRVPPVGHMRSTHPSRHVPSRLVVGRQSCDKQGTDSNHPANPSCINETGWGKPGVHSRCWRYTHEESERFMFECKEREDQSCLPLPGTCKPRKAAGHLPIPLRCIRGRAPPATTYLGPAQNLSPVMPMMSMYPSRHVVRILPESQMLPVQVLPVVSMLSVLQVLPVGPMIP